MNNQIRLSWTRDSERSISEPIAVQSFGGHIDAWLDNLLLNSRESTCHPYGTTIVLCHE